MVMAFLVKRFAAKNKGDLIRIRYNNEYSSQNGYHIIIWKPALFSGSKSATGNDKFF